MVGGPRESVMCPGEGSRNRSCGRASDRAMAGAGGGALRGCQVRGGITAVLVAGRDAERDFGVARMVCREDTAIVEGNAVTFSGSRLAIAGPEEDCDV